MVFHIEDGATEAIGDFREGEVEAHLGQSRHCA
jgi:hypothetical protein